MAKIEHYFRLAKTIALKGDKQVKRHYRLGAVGIRTDGAIVTANNISCQHQQKLAHAEARLVRKLNKGSEVFVVRILRNGELAQARPCLGCQKAMRNRGVKRCYYSISDHEFGALDL